MKAFDACDVISNAKLNLDKARIVLGSVQRDYFESIEPDMSTIKHEYQQISTFLDIVGDYLYNMEPLLQSVTDALTEQFVKERAV